MSRFVLAFAFALLTVGCGDDAAPLDAGPRTDAGRDGGSSSDAGSRDAGSIDGGASDGGSVDGGADASRDDGVSDAAISDAGSDAGSDAMPGDAGACGTIDELAPLLEGVFYTSESDYPITYDSEPSRGAVIASGEVAALRMLVGATPAEGAALVPADRFFDRIVSDPTREPPVPASRGREIRDAFEALTESDRLGFEVTEEDGVTVRVYVIGRNRCGEALWLASVAIRT